MRNVRCNQASQAVKASVVRRNCSPVPPTVAIPEISCAASRSTLGKLQASCAADLLSAGRDRSCRKLARRTASRTFKFKCFQVNASGLCLLKTGQTCDSFPNALLKFLVLFSSYWSWILLCYFLYQLPTCQSSGVWFSARTPENTHLGGFKLPAAPIHVDFVLPHEGKFPGAVHESRAQQAPLPQVQGLLNACRRKTQQDAS